MKTKHTAGPWITADNRNGFGREVIITTQYRMDNSMVQICELDEDWSEPFASEQKANARLIAAAPELLEALKRASDLLAAYCGKEWHWQPAINECRAAIAKATGEEAP